jgi:hypothetical protein
LLKAHVKPKTGGVKPKAQLSVLFVSASWQVSMFKVRIFVIFLERVRFAWALAFNKHFIALLDTMELIILKVSVGLFLREYGNYRLDERSI